MDEEYQDGYGSTTAHAVGERKSLWTMTCTGISAFATRSVKLLVDERVRSCRDLLEDFDARCRRGIALRTATRFYEQ